MPDRLTTAAEALLASITSDWDMDPYGEYEAARRRLENDLAAIEAEARAEQVAEVERLRAERNAWRRLARAHCGSRCTDEEHGRLLVQYRAALAATPEPRP